MRATIAFPIILLFLLHFTVLASTDRDPNRPLESHRPNVCNRYIPLQQLHTDDANLKKPPSKPSAKRRRQLQRRLEREPLKSLQGPDNLELMHDAPTTGKDSTQLVTTNPEYQQPNTKTGSFDSVSNKARQRNEKKCRLRKKKRAAFRKETTPNQALNESVDNSPDDIQDYDGNLSFNPDDCNFNNDGFQRQAFDEISSPITNECQLGDSIDLGSGDIFTGGSSNSSRHSDNGSNLIKILSNTNGQNLHPSSTFQINDSVLSAKVNNKTQNLNLSEQNYILKPNNSIVDENSILQVDGLEGKEQRSNSSDEKVYGVFSKDEQSNLQGFESPDEFSWSESFEPEWRQSAQALAASLDSHSAKNDENIKMISNASASQPVQTSRLRSWFKLIVTIIPAAVLLSCLFLFIRRYFIRQRRLSVLDNNIVFTNPPKPNSINLESDTEDNIFSTSTNMLARGGIQINH